MALIHNRSVFSDKQMIKLQESPEDMPAGQTPHTVILFAHNDLVDKVQPGDRVNITGIYRAVPIRVSSRVSNVKSVYKLTLMSFTIGKLMQNVCMALMKKQSRNFFREACGIA